MTQFGETLRQLRETQGLGLRETAAIVGISPANYRRIEPGKEHPPKPEIIKALAKDLPLITEKYREFRQKYPEAGL